ncbi:MAG: globin family protein [Pseudomonadota bacterium]
MTPDQVKQVQSSFQQVVPLGETVGELFYTRLFEIDPGLRRMFQNDMAEQGRKLLKMLAIAVQGLSRLDELVPEVQALGRRHADYGVIPVQYSTVGTALMWTLEKGLGRAFTPEIRNAWAAAYGLLSSTMISAAKAKAA